jgi:hypothetical protein
MTQIIIHIFPSHIIIYIKIIMMNFKKILRPFLSLAEDEAPTIAIKIWWGLGKSQAAVPARKSLAHYY